jgi:hypothetical protein
MGFSLASRTTLKMPELLDLMTRETTSGSLPNLTKQEFATLLLSHMPEVADLADHTSKEFRTPDGRVLRFWHTVFPKTERDEELREWHVQLYTLDQKTPRSLRKYRIREAWVYLAPYDEGSQYKTDPSGKWRYSVWR